MLPPIVQGSRKRKEHFCDNLLITEIDGKANVVTFRKTAASILHDFHNQQKDAPIIKKFNIIKAAAMLIKKHQRFKKL